MFLSEVDARSQILDSVVSGPTYFLPLHQALHTYARADIFATQALPGYDQSAMDGYALHRDDLQATDRWLQVIGEQPAGPRLDFSLSPGHCVRLFTGAPVPRHTGAVVMQEDTETSADLSQIRITSAATEGEFIRRLGADLALGQRLVTAGERLTPARLSLIASQGLTHAPVTEPARISCLSTGSELTSPGQPLPFPGAIYNSNATLIQTLLLASAPAHHSTCVTVSDSLSATQEALAHALEQSDILILTGGVSVGRHDYVRPALLALGLTLTFWKIAVKPGKPFLFARGPGQQLIFGLPGNPVSAYLTYLLFVLPALKRWAGATHDACEPERFTATLGAPISEPGDRRHYWRGICRDGVFFPTGLQQSHALFSLSQATTLACVEPQTTLAPGQPISCLRMI